MLSAFAVGATATTCWLSLQVRWAEPLAVGLSGPHVPRAVYVCRAQRQVDWLVGVVVPFGDAGGHEPVGDRRVAL